MQLSSELCMQYVSAGHVRARSTKLFASVEDSDTGLDDSESSVTDLEGSDSSVKDLEGLDSSVTDLEGSESRQQQRTTQLARAGRG